jgi:hypothetical protein
MPEPGFRFSAALADEAGTPLGNVLLDVDWEPAWECARFAWLRARLPLAEEDARIEPDWDPELGPPGIRGFRVVRMDTPALEFPKSYFLPAVRKAAAALVRSGRLGEGDRLSFDASAHPLAKAPVRPEDGGLSWGELKESWPVTEAPLGVRAARSYGGGSSVGSPAVGSGDDVPLLVPESLLERVGRSSRTAEVETGGVLIGHLHRDPDSAGLWVEVTDELAARHTVAERTKLTFTPQTWTDARERLRARAGNEVMVGWWHSHLGRVVCRDCSEEARRVCQFSRGFFSLHDRHFQRTAFPRAWQVGLVVNDAATEQLSYSVFAWRRGQIEGRDFLTD